jgi:vacuolar-type H+-ATPase subunit H
MEEKIPMEILQEAIDGVERLSKFLKRNKTTQVKSKEEQQIIKATALAWFKNHRPNLIIKDDLLLKLIVTEHSQLFECATRATAREKYQEILKKLRTELISLQSQILSTPTKEINEANPLPDFSPLVYDQKMQKILENRWNRLLNV